MRLIDADKIDFGKVFIGASDFAKDIREAAQKLIDEQPTAYDVDKIVERLQESKKEAIKAIDENGKSEYSLIKIKDLKELFEEYTREQVEIVKSGGID